MIEKSVPASGYSVLHTHNLFSGPYARTETMSGDNLRDMGGRIDGIDGKELMLLTLQFSEINKINHNFNVTANLAGIYSITTAHKEIKEKHIRIIKLVITWYTRITHNIYKHTKTNPGKFHHLSYTTRNTETNIVTRGQNI
jgi:hypothetical protein